MAATTVPAPITVTATPGPPENWRTLLVVGGVLGSIIVGLSFWVLGWKWGMLALLFALYEAWTLVNSYREDTLSEAFWVFSQRPVTVMICNLALGVAVGMGWLGDPQTALRCLMLGILAGHFWFSRDSRTFITSASQLFGGRAPETTVAAGEPTKEKKKMDLTKVVTAVITAVKVVKPDADIGDVVGFVLKIFNRKKDKPAEVPAEIPTHSSPDIVLTPTVPAGRLVTALRSKITGIQNHRGGGNLYEKAEFDRIVSGDNPAHAGDRLHIDITPIDQFGKPFQTGEPGHPEGEDEGIQYLVRFNGQQTVINPVDLAGNGDNDRVTPDNITLHSWHDDYGLTPVVKIHKTAPQGTVEFQAFLNPSAKTNGQRVEGLIHRVRVDPF